LFVETAQWIVLIVNLGCIITVKVLFGVITCKDTLIYFNVKVF
jgi:hypothetical protein